MLLLLLVLLLLLLWLLLQQLKRVADTICLIGAHFTLQRTALSVRNLIHFVSAQQQQQQQQLSQFWEQWLLPQRQLLQLELSDCEQTKSKTSSTHDRSNKSAALQRKSCTWLANLCCQKRRWAARGTEGQRGRRGGLPRSTQSNWRQVCCALYLSPSHSVCIG